MKVYDAGADAPWERRIKILVGSPVSVASFRDDAVTKEKILVYHSSEHARGRMLLSNNSALMGALIGNRELPVIVLPQHTTRASAEIRSSMAGPETAAALLEDVPLELIAVPAHITDVLVERFVSGDQVEISFNVKFDFPRRVVKCVAQCSDWFGLLGPKNTKWLRLGPASSSMFFGSAFMIPLF